MSKRSPASLVRPAPHDFRADPGDTTSCCAVVGTRRCSLPERNELHKPRPADAAARAAYREHDAHVLGEHEPEDEPW